MKYLHLLAITILVLLISCNQQTTEQEKLPSSLPTFDVKVDKGDAFDGYIMLRQTQSPGAQVVIDNKGQVIWYLLGDTTLFRPFTPYQASFVALHSDTKAYDISYKGDTLNTWDISKDTTINFTMHHEVQKTDEGDLITLMKEYVPSTLKTNEPDAKDGFIKNEGIVKLSPEGAVVWRWSLDRRYDEQGKSLEENALPWGHANAILIDKEGHYLISWKDFNEVWKIHSSTGEVIWKYDGSSLENPSDSIVGQHAVNADLDGNYLIFDNGKKRSRAHSFKMAADDSFSNLYNVALPDSLFSSKQGSVYQFAKDRFLFCSSQTKSLIVTNREGEILWLAESDYVSYRAHFVPKEWFD